MYISEKSLNTKNKCKQNFIAQITKTDCDSFFFWKTLHSLIAFCFQTTSQHPPISHTFISCFKALQTGQKYAKSDSGHIDSLKSLIIWISAELNWLHALGRDKMSDRGFVMKLHKGHFPFKDYANYLCARFSHSSSRFSTDL